VPGGGRGKRRFLIGGRGGKISTKMGLVKSLPRIKKNTKWGERGGRKKFPAVSKGRG